MRSLQTLLLTALGLGAVPAAIAAPLAADTPAAPAIISVSYSGNGCPQGSRNDMYGDEDSLNFAFRDFSARFGDTSRSTNCQVHLSLDGGGPGWALSLESVNVRGTLRQPAGSEVSFFTSAYWSATADSTITKERRIANSGASTTSREVNIRQQLAAASPCGRLGILNINFRAALTAGSSGSFTAVNSNTPVTEELSFAWVRC